MLFAAMTAVTPATAAPETIPHSAAMFLASMCGDGKHKVTFRAQAVGTHYFLEEPGGVSVYTFDGQQYRRDKFLKGTSLAAAIKKYK